MSMPLLAIETSTEACSAALCVDGRMFERSEIAPRRHAELILPMIESLLVESSIRRRDLRGIAVGRGPGAFTGVRLAISIAQGLALGLDLPVVAVSSLAALAIDSPAEPGEAILAAIDARMGEVYTGAFRRGIGDELESLGEESVGQAEQLALPHNASWCVVGSGWKAYPQQLAARLGRTPRFADAERFPQAHAVLRLAQAQFARGAGVAPDLALPVYLRDKVAMTIEERRTHSP